MQLGHAGSPVSIVILLFLTCSSVFIQPVSLLLFNQKSEINKTKSVSIDLSFTSIQPPKFPIEIEGNNKKPGKKPKPFIPVEFIPVEIPAPALPKPEEHLPWIGQFLALARDCPQAFFGHMGPKHLKCIINAVKIVFVEGVGSFSSGINLGILDVLLKHANSPLMQALTTSAIFHMPQMLGYKGTLPVKHLPSKFFKIALCSLKKTLNYPVPPPAPPGSGQQSAETMFDISDDDRLGYFRKDFLVNWNHLVWHRYYRFVAAPFRDNRRGELFYYYHRDLLVRYNANRLTAGLPRAAALDITEVIARSKAQNVSSSSREGEDEVPFWSSQNIPGLNQRPDFETMDRRISKAIRRGYLKLDNKERMPMNDSYGIELLVDIMESTQWSVNPRHYGHFGLHNSGHTIITFSSPDGSFPFWKMITPATSLADPIFYPWHAAVSDVFINLKKNFDSYQPIGGKYPLLWDTVRIDAFSTKSNGNETNILRTFVGVPPYDPCEHIPDLSFGERSDPESDFHLDHDPFSYHISLVSKEEVKATVRIFLAPRYDDLGRRFNIDEQAQLFFVLDVFTTYLSPGRNIITRHSNASSLTIDWPRNSDDFRNQIFCEPEFRGKTVCRCGWPSNLLLPKGTPEDHGKGQDRSTITPTFDLFIMVTNGKEDSSIDLGGEDTKGFVYCGLPGHLYPDKKPMGYPFDRRPYNYSPEDEDNPGDLEEFVDGIGNMGIIQIKIFHDFGSRNKNKQSRTGSIEPRESEQDSSADTSKDEPGNEPGNEPGDEDKVNKKNESFEGEGGGRPIPAPGCDETREDSHDDGSWFYIY